MATGEEIAQDEREQGQWDLDQAEAEKLVDFVEYLHKKESIQGSIDDYYLLLEYAKEFLKERK